VLPLEQAVAFEEREEVLGTHGPGHANHGALWGRVRDGFG